MSVRAYRQFKAWANPNRMNGCQKDGKESELGDVLDCENRIDRLRMSSISARDRLENRNLSEGDAKPPLIKIFYV